MGIKFKAVSFKYDQQSVLDQLDFELPTGELTTILGPSGCGKSTLLMLIAGLLTPNQGRIEFNDLGQTPPQVGMVFQDYALYPHLTVLENIAFPLKMQHLPKKQRLQKANELATMLHLTDCLKQKPGALSGGQQQRVAIARALAKQPTVLLLDEPFSNLDAQLRIEMQQALKQLQQRLKITMVVVTHDQDEALHLGQHMLVLNAGQVQQFGTTAAVYQRPATVFVAQFIGNPRINLFSGRQIQPDWQLAVPPVILAQTATIAIRPESIVATGSQPTAPRLGTLQGMPLATEQYGSEFQTMIRCGNQTIVSTALKSSQPATIQAFDLLKSGVYFYNQAQQLIWTGAQVDED